MDDDDEGQSLLEYAPGNFHDAPTPPARTVMDSDASPPRELGDQAPVVDPRKHASMPVSVLRVRTNGDPDGARSLSPSPRKVRFWLPPSSPPSARSAPTTPVGQRQSERQLAANLSPIVGLSDSEAERHPLLGRPGDPHVDALRQRMKFYRALSKSGEDFNVTEYPSHVLPPVFGVFDLEDGKTRKQGALSTVFCIWNTMVGSTLLTIPWGFASAGIVPGVVLAMFLCVISYATCTFVVSRGASEDTMDFSALCKSYLGSAAHRAYQAVSVFVFVGASIAYHNYITSSLDDLFAIGAKIPLWYGAVGSGVVLFVLSMRKDPRFLVRLNSFGILAVLFTIFFIVFEGSPLGHADILNDHKKPHIKYMPDRLDAKSLAPLGGMLGMSFFIHNAILPILANNPKRDHHGRYVLLGFLLALLCYLLVGLMPNLFVDSGVMLSNQNFLKAFPKSNILACITRGALVIQLTTVYPLVVYLIRVEVFGAVLGRKDTYPGFWVLFAVNGTLVAVTTFMAVEVPKVGDVLRWVGAISGFLVIYALPSGVEFGARLRLYNLIVSALPVKPPRLPPRLLAFGFAVLFFLGVGAGIFALQFV